MILKFYFSYDQMKRKGGLLMNELTRTAVNTAKTQISQRTESNAISEDRAFSYVLLNYYYSVTLYEDQDDLVTDGSNDGGIDFLYFDDDDNKLFICQSKYTSSLSYEDVINELGKMSSTIENFKSGNTGAYNDRLKKALQNAIDRLPDEEIDNIEYIVFTTAEINTDEAIKKLSNSKIRNLSDSVTLYSGSDIEKHIQDVQEMIETVESAKLKIDESKNILKYESETAKGIMVNLQSQSLISLYNKFANKGLFDMNIRRYIRHKVVDGGINQTLDNDRENFWFLNNGIIIACEEFTVSGDIITINKFSIVNGGQTTTLIGKYKGTNNKEFFIPCKIVSEKNNPRKKHDATEFFTKIAEASNSQKQIYPRDLKSNSPEMLRLKKCLLNEKIYLEIKRGVKNKDKVDYSIKNDILGQLILSMVYQRPGTSRSQKKKIFESPDIYNRIYKANYDKDAGKKGFIVDLIKFYNRYTDIETKLKLGGLTEIQTEILKNGTQIIFALIGVVYMLVNEDVSFDEMRQDSSIIRSRDFVYGKYISNYAGDDIDEKIRKLVVDIVKIASEAYVVAFQTKQATSVSNFFKTDNKYQDAIIRHFIDCKELSIGEDLMKQAIILKRNDLLDN